jgi:sugar lactone lactonase YvrE
MSVSAELFIDSRCELGEGVFWHPLQERLFWFDILNKTLFSATAGGIMVDRFTFDTPVTAAGVIDADNLAIASAAGIYRLELSTDTREIIVPLEADKPGNRSNDGRVNPAGGFWIGTMGLKDAGKVAQGALYQVRGAEVTKILDGIYIPNTTCFSPDGTRAYFADTTTDRIRTCEIDAATGLPTGPWQVFTKVTGGGWPDGAVVDSQGFVWCALWGGSRVVRYTPDGKVDREVTVPVSQPTCPAFGGSDLKTLYIVSARENLSAEQLEKEPLAGGVFAIRVDVPGLPENIIKL